MKDLKGSLEKIDLSIKIMREFVVILLIVISSVWVVSNYNINLSELSIFGAKATLVAETNIEDN